MDDVLRRLGIVESLLAQTREVMSELKADVSALKATLPHLASKADLCTLETKIIRWLVGTLLAAVSATFTIAKFVN